MPTKGRDKCVFNEEVKQKIYNLYRESNLAVLEYIAEITKTWDDIGKEFLQDYMNTEDKNEEVKIFWNAMEHYGMEDYISEQESKL